MGEMAVLALGDYGDYRVWGQILEVWGVLWGSFVAVGFGRKHVIVDLF